MEANQLHENNNNPKISIGMHGYNNDGRPLITTIIPTYRRPNMLRRAIRSVLSQTYHHFQVCVYDNASGDETASVVAELAKADPRVKYHCHSENIGAFGNFNYGMTHVDTPFFSFLSDDDILLPEFYQTAMEGFEKYPDAIFSAGATIHMTDKGKITSVPLSVWQRDGYYIPPDGILEMLEKGHPEWTAILFRKEAIEKIGGLDQDVGAPSDLDFELRVAARFPLVISKKPCAIWVNHPLSSIALLDIQSIWPGWLKMIRNLTEDEQISLAVRIRARYMLTEKLKQNLFWVGSGCIKRRDFENTYKAIDILRDCYHPKTKIFILYTMAKFREHCPPAYYFLVCLYKIRKFLNCAKYKQLQKQFGRYARFLEM